MEHQTKRMRLGTKSCTECRRRKVRCIFDERQSECRQCMAHSLACQSQQVLPPSSEDKDRIIQELTQFVGQVESRMISMQIAIDTLASKLDSQAAGNANTEHETDAENNGQQDEVELYQKTPVLEYFKSRRNKPNATPISGRTDPELNIAVEDLIPNRQTLTKVLEYTDQAWSTWPLSNMRASQRTRSCGSSKPGSTADDAGFPGSFESALAFIDDSLRSIDFGLVSKCLVWLCLCYQQLPRDFKDVETDLPLRTEEMIKRYLLRVETFYQVRSAPVCNLDFIEALALRSELFLLRGLPCKAWQSTRAGVDSAMLLELHLPGNTNRERDVWETLWTQDRRISLFLGMPYSVPEYLISSVEEDKHMTVERKVLRKLAMVSGHISDRDLLRKDVPYSATERITQEMDELETMIPDKWGTQKDLESSLSFPQVVVHSNIKLLYYTTRQMVHLPYARLSAEDKRTKVNQLAGFDAAEAAIQAYQDMRALETGPNNPIRSEFYDFLGFTAALPLNSDLVSPEPSTQSMEEQERRWAEVTQMTKTMRETSEILNCTVAAQSADVLENFQAACKGTFSEHAPYEVTIPYFGEVQIIRAFAKDKQRTRYNRRAQVGEWFVELKTNAFSFRRPNECLSERELVEDWSADFCHDFTWGWEDLCDFCASNSRVPSN
ncbi:hypothetical protein F53441_8418 [Fusarium austroafricanum]|uniref:Zn(2)-C6 fungal-type domain-containing protein n=1 Tax=Fusarium austroafricanum TaxID=2364996 RepID=A0A8H4KBC7_9HYPO|nr:hypothetical protein F53441_8418 [Fusarium austroafricanum]